MLANAGLPTILSVSHIVPLLIGDANLCKEASDLMMSKHKIFVQPTIVVGTERLSFTPSRLQNDEHMIKPIAALADVWGVLGIRQFQQMQSKIDHVTRCLQ